MQLLSSQRLMQVQHHSMYTARALHKHTADLDKYVSDENGYFTFFGILLRTKTMTDRNLNFETINF